MCGCAFGCTRAERVVRVDGRGRLHAQADTVAAQTRDSGGRREREGSPTETDAGRTESGTRSPRRPIKRERRHVSHASEARSRHSLSRLHKTTMAVTWNLPFLEPGTRGSTGRQHALIILNQPFPYALLDKLWHTTAWHCCADGGANRLHDILAAHENSDLREKCVSSSPRADPTHAFSRLLCR